MDPHDGAAGGPGPSGGALPAAHPCEACGRPAGLLSLVPQGVPRPDADQPLAFDISESDRLICVFSGEHIKALPPRVRCRLRGALGGYLLGKLDEVLR